MAPLIISGEADIAFSGGTHSGYTDSGQMRLLASVTRDRQMAYPDVPTLRELGYDMKMHAYRVVAVPRDTPDEQVVRLAAALEQASRDERFVQITESRLRMPVTFVGESKLTELFRLQVLDFEALSTP